ncbi:unnamed protein product [Mytilus coruscus]|uniref:Uncharacterized protein n=1 Tax=Mytilus coruscus TaxID=42192 RepID=A0A6J8EUC0_MYTCO|nr:unnamed protein product [Mytilus coruscus]
MRSLLCGQSFPASRGQSSTKKESKAWSQHRCYRKTSEKRSTSSGSSSKSPFSLSDSDLIETRTKVESKKPKLVRNGDPLMNDPLEVIVKLSKGKKLHKFEKEIYDLIAVQRSDDQGKYTSQCAAILGIVLLLKEKFNQVLYFSDSEETEEPFLLIIKNRILSMGNDLFELKVDGDVIFRCDTFLELITGLIASIYCFNLVYPKPIEKSL